MKMRVGLPELAAWFGRLVLGGIFVCAAVAKMNSPRDFADSIAAFQLLPPAAINLVALGLPVFELACGLLVLTGFRLRLGALGMLTMLFVFGGALGLAQVRGLSLDCGCFGGHSWFDARPALAMVRDGILLVLAWMVYRFSGERVQRTGGNR